MTAALDGSVLYLVPNVDQPADRKVWRNAPFNDDGRLYAFGDAIGLGQAAVFVDRVRGSITLTVGNARPGATLRIGAMSSKRRRVVKAVEVEVSNGRTFSNAPRDHRLCVTLTAADCKRIGLRAGVKLAVQAVDGGQRGDITWLPLWSELEIRPRS